MYMRESPTHANGAPLKNLKVLALAAVSIWCTLENRDGEMAEYVLPLNLYSQIYKKIEGCVD